MTEQLRAVLRRWKTALWVGLVAAGVAYTADRLGVLERAELVAYDVQLRLFRHRPGKSKDITIIAIDDRTFQEFRKRDQYSQNFGTWPYSRNLWARVVEYLAKVGARALVFDVVMDERDTEPANDEAFKDAIRAARMPVYIGFSVLPLDTQERENADRGNAGRVLPRVAALNRLEINRTDPVREVPDDELGVDPAPNLAPEEVAAALAFPVESHRLVLPLLTDVQSGRPSYPLPPIPQLLTTLPGFGLVVSEEDPDGVLRRTRFAYTDGANTYVTLSVGTVADLLGADRLELSPGRLRLGRRELRINDDGSAETDYAGTLAERFFSFSLFDIAEDWAQLHKGEPLRIDSSYFKGRVVVVGGFAVGTYDQKATPFESRALGVIKQVTELETLLNGAFITRTPGWVGPAWALVLALISALIVLAARSAWLQLAWLPLGSALVFAASGAALSARWHLPSALPTLAVVLASAAAMGANYLFADRERERMQSMFSRYVSRLVVDQLATQKELPRLDGENREVTAFFSDIRKFSTFSEKFKDDPKQLVRLLNTYLTRVSGALLKHGACLDKYIGDAVVCIFGAPLAQADHAIRACGAALDVQAEVALLRTEYAARGLPDVYTRIGVNSAVMFVGNFGSEQLFNYTAMGDGMNLASRLEGANKAYETLIMIGPRTYELARDFIEARELDRARVAGKTEAVAVYELMALKGQLAPERQRVVALYLEGLALYRAARFGEACRPFEEGLRLDPKDGPSKVMLARCHKLIETPPKMPFDGVIDLDK